MKSKRGFVLILALTLTVACGSDAGSTNLEAALQPKATAIEPASSPTEEAETIAASRSALVVLLSADTPDCTKLDQGKLIYVVEEAAFKYCNQGAWTPIDLKGQRGEIGAKGDTGPMGSKGDTGPTGPKGETGSAGKVTPNYWDDTITGRRWFLTGYLNVPYKVTDGLPDLASKCPAGWRPPTKVELIEAAVNGLYLAMLASGVTSAAAEAYSTSIYHYQNVNLGIDLYLPVPVLLSPTPTESSVTNALQRVDQTPGRNIGLYCMAL